MLAEEGKLKKLVIKEIRADAAKFGDERRTVVEEAARAGFELEDYEDDDPFEVWPDNWPAVSVFEAMATQWRVGLGGVVTRREMYGIAIGEWPIIIANAVTVALAATMDEMAAAFGPVVAAPPPAGAPA